MCWTESPLSQHSVNTQSPLSQHSVTTQSALSQHSVSTQSALSQRSVSTQSPLSHHSGTTQSTLSQHSVNNSVNHSVTTQSTLSHHSVNNSVNHSGGADPLVRAGRLRPAAASGGYRNGLTCIRSLTGEGHECFGSQPGPNRMNGLKKCVNVHNIRRGGNVCLCMWGAVIF